MEHIIIPSPAGRSGNYLVYTALLTQTGTDAPVATVLENTLGGVPVWTKENDGQYRITLAGAFPANKTGLFLQPLNEINSSPSTKGFAITRELSSPDSIDIGTLDETGAETDDMLYQTMIEIRVYP